MEVLFIHSSNDSPNVILDQKKGIFEISGVSYNEHIKKFYAPIFEWFDMYSMQPNEETIIKFHFIYCNSASIKAISILFDFFEKIILAGFYVVVHWYYHPEDDDMLALGRELKEGTLVPFQFLEKE